MAPAAAAAAAMAGGYAAQQQQQQHDMMNKEEEEEEEKKGEEKSLLASGPLRLVVALLYLASIVESLTLLMIPSVLLELRAAFALSVFQAGLLTSVSSFLAAAFSPIAGYVATFASRVQVIVVGVLCCGVSSLVLGLSQSFTHVAISCAISGLGVCLISPAVRAMLADVYPKEQRGKGFGLLAMLTLAGGMIGMTVATMIANKPVLGFPGWRMFAFLLASTSFCLAACVHALGLDPCVFSPHDHHQQQRQQQKQQQRQQQKQQQRDDCRHRPYDRHSQRHQEQLSPRVFVAAAPSSSQSSNAAWNAVEILDSNTAVANADVAAAIASSDGRRGVEEEEDEEQQKQLHQGQQQPRGAIRENTSGSGKLGEEDTLQRQNLRDVLVVPSVHVAAAAGRGEGEKECKQTMCGVLKSSLEKVWTDLREAIAIPTILLVLLAVAASSIPGRVPSLYAMYFELSQFSHADAASLMLVFGLSVGAGAFLGGCIGDLMSRLMPDAGRVLCGHFSASTYPLLQWWMLRGLPRGGGVHWASYAALLCLSGLTGTWSGAGMIDPLLAEVSPRPLLTFVYACEYAVSSLVGSLGGPLAGAAAEIFGFDAATKKEVDPHHHPDTHGRRRMRVLLSTGNESKDLSDADALSKGLVLSIVLPSLINVSVYFMLYWFYPKDRDRALTRVEEEEEEKEEEEEEKEEERVRQGDRQPLLRPIGVKKNVSNV